MGISPEKARLILSLLCGGPESAASAARRADTRRPSCGCWSRSATPAGGAAGRGVLAAAQRPLPEDRPAEPGGGPPTLIQHCLKDTVRAHGWVRGMLRSGDETLLAN